MKKYPLWSLLLLWAFATAPLRAHETPTAHEAIRISEQQRFLQKVTEVLGRGKNANVLPSKGAHLGVGQNLSVDQSILSPLGTVLNEFKSELPRLSDVPLRVKWYKRLWIKVQEIAGEHPIHPGMPLESTLAWGAAKAVEMVVPTFELFLKELPREGSALVYEGLKEHGWMYFGFTAATYPPYFIGMEMLEHNVLPLPPGFGCAQIQFMYFAASSGAMVPISALCARAQINTETPARAARVREMLTNLKLYLKDFSLHQKLKGELKVLSLEEALPHFPLFTQELLRGRDFAAVHEDMLGKLAKHPLFWTVVYLLAQKEHFGPDAKYHSATWASTLASQVQEMLGTGTTTERASEVLSQFSRRMLLYQQVAFFRLVIQLHGELLHDLSPHIPYRQYMQVRGAMGTLKAALRIYDYSLRFVIDRPDLVEQPEAYHKLLGQVLTQKFLGVFRLLDEFYESENKDTMGDLIQVEAEAAAATLTNFSRGQYAPTHCESAAQAGPAPH